MILVDLLVDIKYIECNREIYMANAITGFFVAVLVLFTALWVVGEASKPRVKPTAVTQSCHDGKVVVIDRVNLKVDATSQFCI